ncbi:Na+/H+ antiporter subunit E [Profundibacterium mesophilum]|uniref:PH adaption potassium efflux system PhaE subunit n=1 Tax=Profundibacterium mesophilum KAUST100406-0324 TaxID=1037889 RepID=A0A921NV37_9RHOB|nr:Na+/H+ antiporter subunit E [Profundibacterium mesophilum]KAF0676158.1 pH adaption potassium efflux system PhaE subunit [Profundibacterium mesophilum KAUST100406-0324]
MAGKLFPHPLLTALLILIWCLLVNEFRLGTLVFGTILGVLIPIATHAYWPDRPRVPRPWRLAVYVAIVIWDIIVANIHVAFIVLFKRNSDMSPAWVVVPLDLRTPEAITMLAGTITLTPGTVSADLSADGLALLVHALDAPDPDAVRDEIKQRYERRLLEIFE